MYICAHIRHEPVRPGNIGLLDGGMIKGVPKDGIRDGQGELRQVPARTADSGHDQPGPTNPA